MYDYTPFLVVFLQAKESYDEGEDVSNESDVSTNVQTNLINHEKYMKGRTDSSASKVTEYTHNR